MGLSLNGHCYENATALMEGFVQQFPAFSAPVVIGHVSSSFAGSTLTYSLQIRYMDSNVINVRSGTVVVPACPFTSESLTLAQVFAIPSAAEGGAAWAAGFVLPFALALCVWGIRQIFDVVSLH